MGEVVEFFSGLTYSPDNVIDNGGTFVLRSSNVRNGEIVDADNVYVRSDIVNSDNVRIGDVIVVVRNGSRNLIGKHAQIKQQMYDTVIGAFMTGIRSETPNFTNAMLDTQQFYIEINKNLGATINQITTGAFKKMKFYIPFDKVECELVGAFFNRLDNLITLHQRKLAALQQLKQGFLESMFPKKGESVPKLRLANFDGEWEQRKVRDLFRVTRGNVLAASKTSKLKTDSAPYPVYSSQTANHGLMGYYKDYLYNDAITWTTDGANAGTVNFREGKFYCTNVCGVLISEEGYANKMVTEALNMIAWKHVSKVGNPKLMNNVMSEITLFIPPNKKEQSLISGLFEQIDKLITLHQSKLKKLESLKQSYLQKLFI